MDLAFTGPTRFTPPHPARKQAGKLLWVIVGSVFIHVIVLASLSFPPSREAPQQDKPINAILYIPTPAIIQPDDTPEPTLVEPPVEEITTADTQPATQSADPTEQQSMTADQNEPARSEKAHQQIEERVPEQQIPVTDGEILTQAEDSPAVSTKRISTAINKAIAGQQLQQQYELAEEAARQRRQQLSSPDLKIGEYAPKEESVGEYAINCDKGVNSSVAMVARLFGGNVKCNERNEFQQFIDKRQHKQKSPQQ